MAKEETAKTRQERQEGRNKERWSCATDGIANVLGAAPSSQQQQQQQQQRRQQKKTRGWWLKTTMKSGRWCFRWNCLTAITGIRDDRRNLAGSDFHSLFITRSKGEICMPDLSPKATTHSRPFCNRAIFHCTGRVITSSTAYSGCHGANSSWSLSECVDVRGGSMNELRIYLAMFDSIVYAYMSSLSVLVCMCMSLHPDSLY